LGIGLKADREGVELNQGDVVLLNDPYISGTHLNDVMVMEPVYAGGRLVGYVVNKAHHVDVGGPTPGSINPLTKIKVSVINVAVLISVG